jgi:hypothetical protein
MGPGIMQRGKKRGNQSLRGFDRRIGVKMIRITGTVEWGEREREENEIRDGWAARSSL